MKVRMLTTVWEKSKGLIGADPIEPVCFSTRWGIHTFGVKFPIDVVILDQSDRIVKLRQAVPPNRLFLWNPKFDRVLELPQGTIRKEHMKVGIRVAVKFANP